MRKAKRVNASRGEQLVGVISDTHGLLRPEVIKAFQQVSLIIHAGDVGRPMVLAALKNIAPVIAVRGNTDRDSWGCRLPGTEVIDIGETSLYLLHDLNKLDLEPSAAGVRAVIHGHTHEPAIEDKNGILFLNPGSAGPRRFTLPVSVALLHIKGNVLEAELLTLAV
jgi:putative phosphoesterase